MTAKEMFEELGYRQEIHNDSKYGESGNGIAYVFDKDKKEEVERCGIFLEKHIEIYTYHKSIVCYHIAYSRHNVDKNIEEVIQKHSDAMYLNMPILKAINKQIEELGWEVVDENN